MFPAKLGIIRTETDKFLIKLLDGEAHHIEVGSVDPGDPDVPDPLLGAISPGFVEGMEIIDVIVDLI